jgi:hypothetical protein
MALNAVISEWQNKQFKYGTADCCIFAGACIKAVCGVDPSADWQGSYRTANGAHKVLKKIGGLEAVLDKHFKRIDLKLVQRGDVCLHILADGSKSLAIWWANYWWAMGENGCVRIDCKPVIVWGVCHG